MYSEPFDWFRSRALAITVGLTVRNENAAAIACDFRAEVYRDTAITHECAITCASIEFTVAIMLRFKVKTHHLGRYITVS